MYSLIAQFPLLFLSSLSFFTYLVNAPRGRELDPKRLKKVAGTNIRNKIAHGIMDSDEGNGSVARYFFAAVIKLLSWYSPECNSIYGDVSNDFEDAMNQFRMSA